MQLASGRANDEEASADGSQANAIRGSPAEKPAINNLVAAVAKAVLRAPASGSIITSASLSTTTFNNNYSSAQLTMDFSLPDGRLSAGDTSTIKLPEGFKFVSDYDFGAKSSDGAKVTRAHTDAAAGTMTLTYTGYVENHSDVTGTIAASVTANRETIGDFGKKQFDLNVGGAVVPVGEVDYEKWTGDSPDEVIAKWGNASNSTDGTIAYTIRVNGKGQDISDAVVSDALKSPGMSYVEDGGAGRGQGGKPRRPQLHSRSSVLHRRPLLCRFAHCRAGGYRLHEPHQVQRDIQASQWNDGHPIRAGKACESG